MTDKIALILPTYNAEKELQDFLPPLQNQTLQPSLFAIDSSSSDNTKQILINAGFKVHTIPKSEFNHGGTRQLATTLIDADIYIFMTQDAILAANNCLEKLVAALKTKDDIACSYGRQLPKKEATVISAHGRYANYPTENYIRYLKDKEKYGIKTCFNSNNLAAYRKAALNSIGGFPRHIMTAEDAYVAGKFLKAGFGIHYASDATIYHSHNLTLPQEFHRYFSIGVFHAAEDWLLKEFNTATGEGFKFVISEINYLMKKKKPHLLPRAMLSTIIKLTAYKLGLHSKWIPYAMKKNLGINKNYWVNQQNANDNSDN